MSNLNIFFSYSTLDLDHYDKERLYHIIDKIHYMCNNVIDIHHKESWSKGYHVILHCRVSCDFCRFIYDDPKRYFADLTNRRVYEMDVLWQRKIPHKNLRTFLQVLNTRHTNR